MELGEKVKLARPDNLLPPGEGLQCIIACQTLKACIAILLKVCSATVLLYAINISIELAETNLKVSHGLSRVAKCRGYDGYIRVKIFAGWGKKSGRTGNLAKNLGRVSHNLCKISVHKPVYCEGALNICGWKKKYLGVVLKQSKRILDFDNF